MTDGEGPWRALALSHRFSPIRMSHSSFLALTSVIIVGIIPLLGIAFLFIREDFIRKGILFFVSFSTGALLGDVFLHMIPEMSGGADFNRDMEVVLAGIVLSFLIEKVIHWRHCHVLPGGTDDHEHVHVHPMGPLNLIGGTIHNFIDGLVIAGSYAVSIPIGITTTLAIVFHEIPREIGDFAVLLHSGYSRRNAVLFNIYAQMSAILGTVLFLLASREFTVISSYMLPFAAGNFVYIAGSDLIPELHKETGLRHSLLQLGCMVLGILVMFAMTLLE